MSHELIFLPYMLGQTWAEAFDAATQAAASTDERLIESRLAAWPTFVLHAADILGPIEEHHARRHCELVNRFTGLRFTFHGSDAVLTLPYWYDATVARKACGLAYRLARAVESDIGLAPFDPQLRVPLAGLPLDEFLRGYLDGRDQALSPYDPTRATRVTAAKGMPRQARATRARSARAAVGDAPRRTRRDGSPPASGRMA